jgi:hypothetical protein
MYASNAKANAGLTTGIIGTAGFGLNLLGNLLGGGTGCMGRGYSSEDMPVNRYELKLTQEIEAEKSKNALLEASIYTDQKIADAYARLERRINENKDAIAQQAVYNATLNSTIGCIQGQIAQLYGLTKLVIPNTSVCPGWGNVTVAPAAATTT